MRPLLMVTLFAVVAACGPREPGPAEDERGLVTYWKVTGSDFTQESCTDAPAWTDAVKPPVFAPNTYILYKVAADGRSALAQDCTTTLASSCTDDPDIVFAVDGHTLTVSPPKETRALDGSSCTLALSQAWTLVDGGETATFTQVITLDLEGDPVECHDVDNAVKAQSSNGNGIRGCKVTLTVRADFSHAG